MLYLEGLDKVDRARNQQWGTAGMPRFVHPVQSVHGRNISKVLLDEAKEYTLRLRENYRGSFVNDMAALAEGDQT